METAAKEIICFTVLYLFSFLYFFVLGTFPVAFFIFYFELFITKESNQLIFREATSLKMNPRW